MKNCLILLTNYYPFHKGEEYLESEIEHLAANFRQIFVISTMVSNSMGQTRSVPDNVIVLPVGINHSILGKVNMVVRQYKTISTDKDKKTMIKQDTKGKLLSKLYCYYFESRAMDVYEQAKEKLKNYDFDQYDSITIYSYWLYVTARVALELKNDYFKKKNPLTITRAHRYDLYEYAAPLKYLPERDYLLNGLDAIYPCSQDGVDILKKTYPAYVNKIRVERLGTISTNVVCHTKNDKLYIVSCSVVRKVKRLDLLIEALVELEQREMPYSWTHIGGGPEFENVKKLAKKKLNMENVHFTGFLRNQDVLNWYKENPATVFVNLSSSEGVPVAIMEAISMGLPVIATDVGGTREIVENEMNGYLLKNECTITDIVNCFNNFCKMNKNDYNKMREKALEIWNERCNAEILYSNFTNNLTKDVISKRNENSYVG
ncbi:glycosyltransferase [Heyndrickxia sporothermodurans]|uniref:glycosyltransferase n=1 Tax=Heyndrickxia sporothermodurans TaxID=46224 RepID=UPI002DB71EDC|nr:glycosyltransferase [Heyndrickxia sporothermodurans]MEB6548868.1 glycosyltransferase [Heyndrickxia sporothermodurans]